MTSKMEAPYAAFGRHLIGLRQAAGIPRQADFAARIKTSQQTVSRWEAGLSRPREKQLPVIAGVLGVGVDELHGSAGYTTKTAVRSFDQPFPVEALLPESFERFCAYLLQCLYRDRAAKVHLMGGRGHTQDGTDILVTMEDGAVHSYQCKRTEEFGPQKVHEVVAKHAVKANKKFLLLSRVASPQAREAITIHKTWDIWDRDDLSAKVRELPRTEQVRLVDIFFAGRRFELLGVTEEGIWETPQEFFAAFDNSSGLFNHTWALIGRDDALAELSQHLNEDEGRLVILTGAGGSGKSRVLKRAIESFEASHTGTIIRLLSRTSDVTKKSLEELGNGPTLLVVDDAHDRTDLHALFQFAATRKNSKLLLAIRPYGADSLKAQAGLFGLIDAITELSLRPLTKQQAEELALQVLEKDNGPIQTAKDIANWTYDCPLATVVGAQIVAREKKHFELAKNESAFRAALFSRFHNVIAGEIGQKSDTESVKKLLKLLALLQPFHIDDNDLVAVIQNHEGLPPHETNRLLRLLVDGGVLFKRGVRYRLSPDVLADYIIEATCVGVNNQSTGYAEAVFDKLQPRLFENLIVNLGKLDWRRSDGDASNSRLLDGIWSKLKPSQEYGDPHIKAVAEIAYFQPSRALDFAEHLIRRGAFLNQLPAVIRPAAYNIQYIERACNDLWELGKADRRELNRHTDHPIRILRELCGIHPDKPRKVNEKVVEFGLALLRRKDAWAYRYTAIDVLTPILSTEGNTTSSNNRTISFNPFFVNVAFVKELRQKVVTALIHLLSHPDIKVAVLAARGIGASIRYPIGMFGANASAKTRDSWTPLFIKTLEAVETVVQSEHLDPLVLFNIAKQVSWLAQHGEAAVAEIAKRLHRGLPRRLEARILFSLIDGHGIEHRRIEAAKDFEGWDERISKLAQEVVAAYPDGQQLAQLIAGQLEHLAKGDPEHSASHYALVARLILTSSPFARAIIDRAYLDSAPLISSYAGLAIARLWNDDVAEGRAALRRFIDGGRDELLATIGTALASIDLRERKYGAPEFAALELALLSDNWDAVRNGILALRHFAARKPDVVVQLAAKTNIGTSANLAEELCSLFTWEQLVPFDRLSEDQVSALLDKFMAVPELDGHWLETFLATASKFHSKISSEFFMNRVDRAANEGNWNYRPCNSGPYGHVPLRFKETDDYGLLLARVVLWMKSASYQGSNSVIFEYRARELFDALFGSFDGEVLAYLDHWSLTANEKDFKLIAGILSQAPHDLVFNRSDFVVELLERAKQVSANAIMDISQSLFGSAISGVREGTPGQPFPRDIEMKAEAEEALSTLSRVSPAYTLYEWIKEHAEEGIARANRDQQACEE